ncbi:SDR family NAD(P)-dependent oxidoreductase [Sphingomonas sp.]|jgi:short-subunit dehydrogenase|uniref:SDR family NAD(P)-dependent oxidoreductase n=1 Tax=Sphingomonas sp. TaxID=28214 RepID=UPI002D7FB2F7|nr:SDR family NAD(P)-dependent oxidoreductase [Sphingomonas sp.]HEU0044079.1 SDR family NAD(P)-dependent oxidoreductase [Sphingomonas sp.]
MRHLLAAALLASTLSACATPRVRSAEAARFAGQVYVVTGASSGFGRGFAVRLGRQGARVVLAARRAEVLEEVAAEVRAGGGEALVVATDVADPAQVERLASAAVARFGRIDVWANIAGVGALGRFWEIPVADHNRVVDTNLKGLFAASHAALRQFVAQGHGTLVNMGSVESVVPIAYHSSYAATKAGVLSLGRSLNQELRHAGHGKRIKVATVMPWAADTPFFDHAANYTGRKGRMVIPDGPEKIVDALIWVSLHPREELPVGWKAHGAVAAHWLLPDLTERVSANIQRAEFEKASPQSPTSGSLHRPMAEGRGVDGGLRARMKTEDAARKGTK